MSLLVARNGPPAMSDLSLLWGVKRKSDIGAVRSESDPSRTLVCIGLRPARRGCSTQFPSRRPEARRPTSGDPHALFLRHVSNRAGGGTGDAAIKKFIRRCFSYSSFSQRTTFVNKRGNPVRGWLNVHQFARLRLVVLNEVIARKSWLGDDGSGDSHGDCRKYDVSKAHGYFSSLRDEL